MKKTLKYMSSFFIISASLLLNASENQSNQAKNKRVILKTRRTQNVRKTQDAGGFRALAQMPKELREIIFGYLDWREIGNIPVPISAISHDNSYGASIDDNVISIWDLTTKKRLHQGDHLIATPSKDHLLHVAFTSDRNKVIGLTNNFSIIMWDITTGNRIDCLPRNFAPSPNHSGRISISPNGIYAIVELFDHTTKVAITAVLKLPLKDSLTILSRQTKFTENCAFSADGNYMAFMGMSQVEWDAYKLFCQRCVSPEKYQTIIKDEHIYKEASVTIRDAHTNQIITIVRAIGATKKLSSILLSHNAQYCFVGGSRSITSFENPIINLMQKLKQNEKLVPGGCLSGQIEKIIVDYLSDWVLLRATPVVNIKLKNPAQIHQSTVGPMALSPNGRFFAYTILFQPNSAVLHLGDFCKNKSKWCIPPVDIPDKIQFSPSNNYIFTSSLSSHLLCAYDIDTGRLIFKTDKRVLSPDGNYLYNSECGITAILAEEANPLRKVIDKTARLMHLQKLLKAHAQKIGKEANAKNKTVAK